ncbi:MAG: AAA family ATPase [Candidatus Gracilibacteria bacterium]|nr:AAA family ATPase [Candidatus Gracilibacteria bacterium]MDD2908596.1 AAA family ATPase [Candidatus Gracilibacteria bacterium]
MKKIVIYGKGGIGKSTTSTHLSVAFAKKGLRVLQVGCDPKHDSCKRILQGVKNIPTVIDLSKDRDIYDFTKELIVHKGRFGIDCIEAGGPIAGLGCAGRGISLMFEIFEDIGLLDDSNYDIVIFDVLGDVVCGGFASPLKIGFADEVYIVLSEEIMSLYAANNIAKAIVNYQKNGIGLSGIILNLRSNDSDKKVVEDFTAKLGSKIVGVMNRSEGILQAEKKNMTLFEFDENHPDLIKYKELSNLMLKNNNKIIPHTFSDTEFDDFIYDKFY